MNYAKIINFFSLMRSSYWYNPMLMAIIAILLSVLTLEIDKQLDPYWLEALGWFHGENPNGARVLLSTISTSMITVAGVTFSMTILAVSFAGSQIGPRLTTNFMRDKSNQITLGTFIATFLYCLLILRAVLGSNGGGVIFVPQLSLLVAMIFTLASIIVLIYFIHHIPESIDMSNVIANVGKELYSKIDEMFPKEVGEEYPDLPHHIPGSFQDHMTTLNSSSYGYIRVIDSVALIHSAKINNHIIKLLCRPGHFATKNSDLLIIYSQEQITDELKNDYLGKFAFGFKRNQEQDMQFLFDELIEIIGKALSPGINDPYTAMTAIDWIQLSLERMANKTNPSPYRYDSEKNLRLIAHFKTFDDFCDLIFNRITPYVCTDINTSLHLMESMVYIYHSTENNKNKITLSTHAKHLNIAGSQCLPVKEDQLKLQSFYNENFKD